MNMKTKTLFSEDPESDIWRELEQFTYEGNIKKYFSERDIDASDELINSIAGSFLQAHEYYKSANITFINVLWFNQSSLWND